MPRPRSPATSTPTASRSAPTGTTWHPLWSAADQAAGTWQTRTFDLAAAAASRRASRWGRTSRSSSSSTTTSPHHRRPRLGQRRDHHARAGRGLVPPDAGGRRVGLARRGAPRQGGVSRSSWRCSTRRARCSPRARADRRTSRGDRRLRRLPPAADVLLPRHRQHGATTPWGSAATRIRPGAERHRRNRRRNSDAGAVAGYARRRRPPAGPRRGGGAAGERGGADAVVTLPAYLTDGGNYYLGHRRLTVNISDGTSDAYDGGLVHVGFPGVVQRQQRGRRPRDRHRADRG